MSATVTLSSTTLTVGCGPSDTSVVVVSATNIQPGLFLFIEQEFMKVVSTGVTTGGGTVVNVLRGRGGLGSHRHSGGATVYIGRGDQFYNFDPSSTPGAVVLVTPHINVTNGNVWLPQGDDLPALPGVSNTARSVRWWQLQTSVPGFASLGVRSTTQNPSTSN